MWDREVLRLLFTATLSLNQKDWEESCGCTPMEPIASYVFAGVALHIDYVVLCEQMRFECVCSKFNLVRGEGPHTWGQARLSCASGRGVRF